MILAPPTMTPVRLAVGGRLDEDAAAVAGVVLGEIFQHHVLRALQAEVTETGLAVVEIVADEIARAAVEPEGAVIIRGDGEVAAGDVLGRGSLPSQRGIQHRGVFVPDPARTFAARVFGIPERIVGLALRSIHGAGIFANTERRAAVVGAQPGQRPP
jgi:hypothetical protein